MLEYRKMDFSPEFLARDRDSMLLHKLQQLDTLRGSQPETAFGLACRNKVVAGALKQEYSSQEAVDLRNLLRSHDSFKLNPRGYKVNIGGEPHRVITIAATDAETNGDMSEKVWIRDQTQVGAALFEMWKMDQEKYASEGELARDVLRGALHLMATDAQLDRFDKIIASNDKAFKSDYRNYPQITIEFGHLDSATPTEWRHKQEAWQMLGITALDALDRGLIKSTELLEEHKQFLGSMMPFLRAIDFTTQPNSASWEELEAVRTSVIGVETALLHKIREKADKPGFAFLREGFARSQAQELTAGNAPFEETLDAMIDQGLQKIGKNLPDEAAEYSPTSPKYRTADAALLYLLDYDIPKLLSEKHIPIKAADDQPLAQHQIEELLLAQVLKLYDPTTHGIRRYGGKDDSRDTYLSPNYTTDSIQEKIKQKKKELASAAQAENRPVDLDEKFVSRQEITLEGESAAWVHFDAQIADWAAKQYLETGEEWYYKTATTFMNLTLSMVTGEGEHHALPNKDGIHEIQAVKPWLFPECYVTMIPPHGKQFVIPSPNTPLTWAKALADKATARFCEATARKESIHA